MKISVLGAGAFGTALAIALGFAGRRVTLWGRDAEAMAQARETRRVPRLPGAQLPEIVSVTPDLDRALEADILLLSIPTQKLGPFLAGLDRDFSGKALVACCKGIDLQTLDGPAAIVARHAPGATPAILTGPSFAADIANGLPTALTLGTEAAETGKTLQHAIATPVLRLYRTTDVRGAELGGALKNVIAIASGAAIGAGLGESARAAVMTRGFAEMQRLAADMGAQPATLMGLAGFGDLTLTCTSTLSRNYRFGISLGEGSPFDTSTTVEGAATAQAVAKLAVERALDLPISTTVADLTQGRYTVPEALRRLLDRPLKEE